MLDLPPGTILGQYVLRERLGRGATSIVYHAHHPSLDRDVAIKVLAADLVEVPGFLERFRREARSVSRLRHPNIVTVFDFGTQDGITYMVSELLPGGTLASRLGRPLALDQARTVLAAIAAALDYAHASGLIHRDVKPSNILFTRDHVPVLSDFGIARMLENTEPYTVPGTVIGTPEYLSPEQAAGREVGSATDLYSLGIVLYEMLAGRAPFRNDSPMATVLAHAETPAPPARSFNPELPVEFEAVLDRALAKRPEQRYQHGSDLVDAFDGALRTVDGPPTPRPGVLGEIVGPAADAGDTETTVEAWPEPVTPPAPFAAAPAAGRSSTVAPLFALAAFAIVVGVAVWFGRGLLADRLPSRGVESSTSASSTSVQPPQPGPADPLAAPAPGPTAVLGATVPPTAPPTSPPGATAAATPPTDPRFGPLAVQILTLTNGQRVPGRPLIRGRRTGQQGPDEHLWMLLHPHGDNNFWWPYKHELIADANGFWEVTDVEIGGPPGTQHDLVVGVATAVGQRTIVDQITGLPDEPFQSGFPAGFKPLVRVTVVKIGQ